MDPLSLNQGDSLIFNLIFAGGHSLWISDKEGGVGTQLSKLSMFFDEPSNIDAKISG